MTAAAPNIIESPIDRLLDRLDKVKRTGPDRWIACCPAHPDKHPTLSVRELADGRVLAHCFAGCAIGEIVDAVGLELSDLYPATDREIHGKPPERRPFNAGDVLKVLANESMIVAVAGGTIEQGGELSADDVARLALANERIQAALDYAGVRYGR